jgi:hypothetical protein
MARFEVGMKVYDNDWFLKYGLSYKGCSTGWSTLTSTSSRQEVVFSDNYFDLPAGRTAAVTLPALEGWTAERIREALRVRSLVDSF